MSDPKTTPVARMQAEGRNPGDGGETGAPDSAALHPGYGTMSEQSPEGWQEVSLGDVLVLMRNGTTSTQVNEVTEFPVTRIETISNGVIDWDRVGYLEKPEPAYQLEYGDILYSHINSIAHMGKVAVYHDCRPLYHGMNLMLLRPNKEYVDPNFIFLVLSSDHGRAYARRECKSAINQASLGQGEIKVLPISLPPLIEQRRIAEILDTLDDAIQKTEQLIAKLKQIKQGLLHDLLTRGIDENGQLRDPIAHPEQFKDSELGRIPRGWRIVPLRQLVESLDAGVSVNAFDYPAASGQIGVLKTSAVNGGKFYPRENKAVLPQEISRVRVRPEADSIIVSRMNTPELVGEHGYVDEFFCDLYLPDRLWLVTFKDKDLISARWLSFFLSTPSAKRHITLHATGTSGSMKNLPKDKFLAMLIPLPGLAEQNLVAEMLESHEDRITLEGCHHQKLQAIKKGLVRDLLTGRVRTIQGE